MQSIGRLALAAALLLGLTVLATAGDTVTLEGKVVCAKCTLKKADAKECQNVLVVPAQHGHAVEYYIVKNKVDEKFGEVCTDKRKAIVTGTVEEKEERRWLTASKMENIKG